MPRPFNERQSLEKERSELPGLIATDQRELAETAITKTRREVLDWQISNAQNRLAYVEARLVTIRNEAN
jgi:hypothetical protein